MAATLRILPKLADVLRAEVHGTDLQQDDDNARIAVCGEREDGTLYELGGVATEAILRDPDGARRAIEQIKWGRRPTKPSSEAASIPTFDGGSTITPPTTQGPT